MGPGLRLNDVLARGHAAVDLYGGLVQDTGMFNHGHSVGAGRQHAPGGNAHGFAGAHASGRNLPHGHLADHFKIGWIGLRGPEGAGSGHGIAVHGGAGKGRNVNACGYRFGQHPSQDLVQRAGFHGHRLYLSCQSQNLAQFGHLEKRSHPFAPIHFIGGFIAGIPYGPKYTTGSRASQAYRAVRG